MKRKNVFMVPKLEGMAEREAIHLIYFKNNFIVHHNCMTYNFWHWCKCHGVHPNTT